jgi:hypothetical protein
MLKDVAAAASPTIRVAAVQMTAELANVDANLAKPERLGWLYNGAQTG